jgi:hypothetical protein
VLDALRLVVAAVSLSLVAAVAGITVAYLRWPPRRRLLRTSTTVLLATSYAVLLVCASALAVDLAETHGEFRWYATPLLLVGTLAGWAVAVMALRDVRR